MSISESYSVTDIQKNNNFIFCDELNMIMENDLTDILNISAGHQKDFGSFSKKTATSGYS